MLQTIFPIQKTQLFPIARLNTTTGWRVIPLSNCFKVTLADESLWSWLDRWVITMGLVVDQPLWKMMDFVSWDDEIPNSMESHKIPWFQTTNQSNMLELWLLTSYDPQDDPPSTSCRDPHPATNWWQSNVACPSCSGLRRSKADPVNACQRRG